MLGSVGPQSFPVCSHDRHAGFRLAAPLLDLPFHRRHAGFRLATPLLDIGFRFATPLLDIRFHRHQGGFQGGADLGQIGRGGDLAAQGRAHRGDHGLGLARRTAGLLEGEDGCMGVTGQHAQAGEAPSTGAGRQRGQRPVLVALQEAIQGGLEVRCGPLPTRDAVQDQRRPLLSHHTRVRVRVRGRHDAPSRRATRVATRLPGLPRPAQAGPAQPLTDPAC